MTGSSLWLALKALREFVWRNERVWVRLERSADDNNKLFASFNAIEDADLAIDAALARWRESVEFGNRLLCIYGALQAMYVQQDAVTRVLNYVDGKPKRKVEGLLPASVLDIRDRRNWTIGHPSDRAGHLIQGTLTSDAPEFHVGYPQREKKGSAPQLEWKRERMDLRVMIAEQRDQLARMLEGATSKLEQEDVEHMRQFSDKLLTPISECVLEAVRGVGAALWKDVGDRSELLTVVDLPTVERALNDLEQALSQRAELKASASTLEPQFRNARHAIRRLQEIAQQGPIDGDRHLDAQAFFEALHVHCERLNEDAKRLDAEYQAGCR